MNDQKITPTYVLTIAGAVIFTWVIHELAHWSTAELFGNDSMMYLNSVVPKEGVDVTPWQAALTSAAGPIITVIQGILAFYLLRALGWNKLLYPFLFLAFYMRFLASAISLMNPNDEARISMFLGLGMWTLPVFVTLGLFYFVYRVSRKYELNWKFQVATVIAVQVFSSALIVLDMFLKPRIL